MDTPNSTLKKKTVPGAKFKSSVTNVPGVVSTRGKKLAEAASKTLIPKKSNVPQDQLMDVETQDTQDSIPNGQDVLEIDSSALNDSLPVPDISSQSTIMSVSSGMPDFVLDFQRQLRQIELRMTEQDSRLLSVESLTAENLQLKHDLQIAQEKIDMLEKSLAHAHHHSLASIQEDVDVDMVAEAEYPSLKSPPRDLSSNASKYAGVASSSSSATTPIVLKKTAAQVAAAAAKIPAKKTITSKQKTAAARAFMERTPGPQGFKYVFIPRSRKLTRIEVRSRLRQVGVDTSRILDIIFPASGVIGILLHIQYVKTFAATMGAVGAKLLDNFDVLDPEHIGDPQYQSYSMDGLADKALELQANRCISALTFLHRTKHYQVASVGRSFVELGWITDGDIRNVMALPVKSGMVLKAASKAGAVFRSVDREDDEMILDGEGDHHSGGASSGVGAGDQVGDDAGAGNASGDGYASGDGVSDGGNMEEDNASLVSVGTY